MTGNSKVSMLTGEPSLGVGYSNKLAQNNFSTSNKTKPTSVKSKKGIKRNLDSTSESIGPKSVI